MLDIGFRPDIERIIRRSPRERQTALLSATMPPPIRALTMRYMRRSDAHRPCAPRRPTVDADRARSYSRSTNATSSTVLRASCSSTRSRSSASSSAQRNAGRDRLTRVLQRARFRRAAHARRPAAALRERSCGGFREGKIRYLVATDVASAAASTSRHLARHQLRHPRATPRTTSTASAAPPVQGRDGKAITFVAEWDMEAWAAIRKRPARRSRKRGCPCTTSAPSTPTLCAAPRPAEQRVLPSGHHLFARGALES